MLGETLHVARGGCPGCLIRNSGLGVQSLSGGRVNEECTAISDIGRALCQSSRRAGIGGVGPRKHSITFLSTGRVENTSLRHSPFCGGPSLSATVKLTAIPGFRHGFRAIVTPGSGFAAISGISHSAMSLI